MCIRDRFFGIHIKDGIDKICPDSHLVIQNQKDIDLFSVRYYGCTDINGYLDTDWDITNLRGLNPIKTIKGRFNISAFILFNCKGMENLTSVGSLDIFGSNLESLEGLENLETIEDDFFLAGSYKIKDFAPLKNLKNVGGGITILWNEQLESLQGLEHINPRDITGLSISGNTQLSDCAINSFCQYLRLDDAVSNISDNGPDCTENKIRIACGDAYIPFAAYYDENRNQQQDDCLLYTSPSPRDATLSRMPSSA